MAVKLIVAVTDGGDIVITLPEVAAPAAPAPGPLPDDKDALVALAAERAGLFSNDDALSDAITKAGEATGVTSSRKMHSCSTRSAGWMGRPRRSR